MYIDTNKKIKRIESVVSEFVRIVKDKPIMFGSLAEIEATFHIVDQIDVIINTEVDYTPNLSWRHFLLSIGGYGPKDSATSKIKEVMKKEKEQFDEFNRLRKKYIEWREERVKELLGQ